MVVYMLWEHEVRVRFPALRQIKQNRLKRFCFICPEVVSGNRTEKGPGKTARAVFPRGGGTGMPGLSKNHLLVFCDNPNTFRCRKVSENFLIMKILSDFPDLRLTRYLFS